MRRGRFDEAELEAQLEARGLMNRFLGRFTRAIRAPWQMYPLGILFGLGFDTATEVALLFLAAGAAGAGPAVVRDPLPAGPVRRGDVAARHDRRLVHELRLRLGVLASRCARSITTSSITALSVAVAFIIGTIELLSVVAEKLQPRRAASGSGSRTSTSTSSATRSSGCSS